LRGGGLWYYDFGKWFSSGWWSEPDYLADIEKMKKKFDNYFEKQHPAAADVLLVFDTRVFFHTGNSSASDPITDSLSVNISSVEAYKTGASVAMCYLSDLERMDLSPFKAIVSSIASSAKFVPVILTFPATPAALPLIRMPRGYAGEVKPAVISWAAVVKLVAAKTPILDAATPCASVKLI
jgi:hypothetical protein